MKFTSAALLFSAFLSFGSARAEAETITEMQRKGELLRLQISSGRITGCTQLLMMDAFANQYFLPPFTSDREIESFFSEARLPQTASWGIFNSSDVAIGENTFSMQMYYHGRPWYMSSLRYDGIHGIVFVNPVDTLEIREFMVYMDVIRRNPSKRWPSQIGGIGLQINTASGNSKNFYVFDLDRWSNEEFRNSASAAYLSAPEEYRSFFAHQYERRLDLNQAKIGRLREISKITEKRTLLLVSTEEGFFDASNIVNGTPQKAVNDPFLNESSAFVKKKLA